MSYPFDSSMLRMLRELERHQEISRSVHSFGGPLEEVRQQQELIKSVLPYYEATRKLIEITGGAKDAAARAEYARDALGLLPAGAPRMQRAMLDLLADKVRLEQSLRTSFLPSFELTDALTRASASVRQLDLAGIRMH